MGSVAIQYGGISRLNLSRVVQDDDLSGEIFSFSGGFVLGVRADISSLDVLNGNVLDVETNIVSGNSLFNGFVMHFDGFNLGGNVNGGESDGHFLLEDTGFNSSDGDSSNTSDLVDILEGESQWFFSGSLGGNNVVQGFHKDGSFVPGHVVLVVFSGSFQHVVSVPSGNGDHRDVIGVVTSSLEEKFNFSADFVVSVLTETSRVHLVNANNHLFDSQSEGQKSVFSGLSVFRNSGFEFSWG